MEDEQCVWKSTLDGRYMVVVTRIAPCHGELVISEQDRVLHRQPVGLMYDALFGPDIEDVSSWKRIAIEFADGRRS